MRVSNAPRKKTTSPIRVSTTCPHRRHLKYKKTIMQAKKNRKEERVARITAVVIETSRVTGAEASFELKEDSLPFEREENCIVSGRNGKYYNRFEQFDVFWTELRLTLTSQLQNVIKNKESQMISLKP